MEINFIISGKWESKKEFFNINLLKNSKSNIELDTEITSASGEVIFQKLNIDYNIVFSRGLHKELFEEVGQTTLSEEQIKNINNSTSTVYISTNISEKKDLFDIVNFCSQLLDNKGIAVYIVSADIIHPKQRWVEIAKNPKNTDLFMLFVGFIIDEEYVYSNGMDIFNLPDVAIKFPPDKNTTIAYEFLRNFAYYKVFMKNAIDLEAGYIVYNDLPPFELLLMNINQTVFKDIITNKTGLYTFNLSRLRQSAIS